MLDIRRKAYKSEGNKDLRSTTARRGGSGCCEGLKYQREPEQLSSRWTIMKLARSNSGPVVESAIGYTIHISFMSWFFNYLHKIQMWSTQVRVFNLSAASVQNIYFHFHSFANFDSRDTPGIMYFQASTNYPKKMSESGLDYLYSALVCN
jgi:hypothetical protein